MQARQTFKTQLHSLNDRVVGENQGRGTPKSHEGGDKPVTFSGKGPDYHVWKLQLMGDLKVNVHKLISDWENWAQGPET